MKLTTLDKEQDNNYNSHDQQIKAVDFFCGGGGMSYGMQMAGVKVIAGIDFEQSCKETFEANITGAKFLQEDVFDLTVEKLETELNLQRDDNNLILIGCSPCQYWSIINTDKEKSKKSKNLLKEFRKFVEYFNPGYVVVENVPGVLRNKRKSGLSGFITWLKKNSFSVHFDNHDISEYGVPQSRRRFTLLANRITKEKIAPVKALGKKLLVKDVIGEANGFPKIPAGHKDKTGFMHTVAGLKEINIQRLEQTAKNGGSRISYADNELLAPKCHKNDKVNFKDTYGRISWDKLSPTITTKFFSISNGRFAHPEENRAISLREGAILQSFPKSYVFKTTTIGNTARIIGNAVPPRYAQAIAEAIIQNHQNGTV
ncbi:DNA cytosine methyltransferase [Pedobacter sp. MR22-3]|uniref:DNA cytosine methyltransferase n=1 Tax=Pedobacter sp. MR22-3 TaxID=2994552 RepID=UPI0022472CB1|nr:DNA cytosine methyltransferase [Pedobacter sp. MR22-3]MCX2582732.1 DNA cytosine methyltransferase [Pedobacter sp. MR22-3]